MVDINLLGDDQEQQYDGDEKNDDFSNTYNEDKSELSSEPNYSDLDFDQNLYDKSYAKGGSKKSVFIIGGLIIVIAVLASVYYLTSHSNDESQQIESTNTKVADIQEPLIDISKEVSVTEQPAVEVPGFIKEMVNSTQHGIRTVETILATIPKDVNFTLIQYRDGNFLTELLGKSNANISDLNNQLQQKLAGGNVKVTRDKRNIRGVSYQQALLDGNFSTVDVGLINIPNYMGSDEIKNEFTQFCQQLGLNLKQFDVKSEVRTANLRKIPVIFSAKGNKDSALNFLNKLIEKNINVNLSKIVLVPTAGNFNDKRINLILNMEIYHPI